MEGGERMAISITDVKYTPDPLVAGKKVKATCKVTADEGIESVKIYDPEYRTLIAYDDGTHGDDVAEDGVYTLVEDIPYDAPAGVYYVTIVATDKKGNVERKTSSINIG
jgi:hypothetical protein